MESLFSLQRGRKPATYPAIRPKNSTSQTRADLTIMHGKFHGKIWLSCAKSVVKGSLIRVFLLEHHDWQCTFEMINAASTMNCIAFVGVLHPNSHVLPCSREPYAGLRNGRVNISTHVPLLLSRFWSLANPRIRPYSVAGGRMWLCRSCQIGLGAHLFRCCVRCANTKSQSG